MTFPLLGLVINEKKLIEKSRFLFSASDQLNDLAFCKERRFFRDVGSIYRDL